jgi:PhnB protein
MASVKPIPEGYHSVTPYLIIKDAARAIDFYTRAFGAKETVRMPNESGGIMHAEIKIGDSTIMMSDENLERNYRGPTSIGGSPVSIMLYVEDVDATYQRAVDAGATPEQPVETQFYGDRMGGVADPFGYKWWIGTHVEDVSPEELEKRATAAKK